MNADFRKNISSSLLSFMISILMTLWFTPFIINSLGVEAYGYTSIITNLINITTIVTLAITSMSSRYISIELQRDNINDANKYFNSILFTLIILSGFLLIIFSFLTFNLEKFMKISNEYISDVKILFFITFLQFLIGVITTPFLGGIYYQNKLKIIYNFNILNYFFKFLISVAVFNFFRPILWIPNLAVLIVSIVTTFFYIASYKKMMPGVFINKSKYNFLYMITIMKSGLWISISKAGSVLLGTLNVYFSNIFIGPEVAGVYAAILQLQTLAIVLVNAIVPSFIPEMYKRYANNDMNLLIAHVRKSIFLLSFPIGIVVGGMLVFGKYFMILWLGEEFGQYEFMFVLVIIYLPLILPAEVLNQLNITMNKVKGPAFVTLLFGILNIILIYLLLYYANMGVFSIVISQLITTTTRGLLYFPIYSARISGVKISTFYPEIGTGIGITILTFFVGLISRSLITPDSWLKLILSAIVTSFTVIMVIYKLIINKEKKQLIKNKVYTLMKRKIK